MPHAPIMNVTQMIATVCKERCSFAFVEKGAGAEIVALGLLMLDVLDRFKSGAGVDTQ